MEKRKAINRSILLILALYLIVTLLTYLIWGITITGEASKYIGQADLLLKGQFPSAQKYYFYLPIILLIAISQKLFHGLGFVVIFQILLSGLSLTLFFKGVKTAFSKPIALWSSVMLCLFIPLFSWNFFLYSESIFISFSLILLYFLCKFYDQKVYLLFCIFLLLVLLIFTRPFGILFIPAVMFHVFLTKFKNALVRICAYGLSITFLVCMFLFANKIFKGGEDMNAMKPFREEHVICLVPNNPNGANLNLRYFDNGVRDILYYIVHNPTHFMKLAFKRLYSFFSLTRPWYSKIHNLMLQVFLYPIYFSALFGVIDSVRYKIPICRYLLAFIISYSLAITLQCDDWSGRFTMAIVPPVFLFSVIGSYKLKRLITQLIGNYKSSL